MKKLKNLIRLNSYSAVLFTALFFSVHIGFTQPSSDPKDAKSTAKKIKIALLLDTSNSMDGLIEQAKSQLWTLVNELAQAKCDNAKPEIKIALYEYGNDRLPASEGYIKMVTPLTDDLDKISEDLFKLTTQGGSEFCGHVIQTALRQLDWSATSEDLQIIFIAGNEPFNQGAVSYIKSCQEARNKNILINTIFCGEFQEGISTFWKNGADLTNGSYISIEQDRKTVFINSPYDGEIAKLNTQLNQTYVEYGTVGKEKKMNQATQDRNAESYGSANAVKRAVSKSTHVYKNKTWDLVDASDESTFDVNKVSKDDLPVEMKSMAPAQKQEYLKTKKEDRSKLQAKIIELNKKRETFVASKQKESASSDKMLDNAMIKAIKSQAIKKKFVF